MPDPSLTGVTFRYDSCLETSDIVRELLFSIIREISRDDLIPMYYTRQFVERAFSYSKEDISLRPLKVHGADALKGYLFLI